jgi:hypothetical protein
MKLLEFYVIMAFREADRVIWARAQAEKWNSGHSGSVKTKRMVHNWADQYFKESCAAEDKIIRYTSRVIEMLENQQKGV